MLKFGSIVSATTGMTMKFGADVIPTENELCLNN